MRTHPRVRLFGIIDILMITSMLPGVDDSIDDVPLGSSVLVTIAFAICHDHHFVGELVAGRGPQQLRVDRELRELAVADVIGPPRSVTNKYGDHSNARVGYVR